jgi:PhoPQ-activated pathogenicity-related protein
MSNKRPCSFSRLAVALALAAAAPLWASAQSNTRPSANPTALDKYIAAPDRNFQHKLVSSTPGSGFTTHLLEMTSQAWLTTNEVDRPLWQHWITIVQPDKPAHPNALLFIGGGANNGKPPRGPDNNPVQIALQTRSIVAELRMVPNQPLVFSGESDGRVEDSLIAYTWDKFLRTGDPKWPARLPMTKSAVRAMDAIQAFCAGPEAGAQRLTGFVVAGGSKRGWTTWTTAAVDRRVIGIVPVVIDVLNVVPSMMHHYNSYGFWAPAIDDYEHFRIMDWTGTPEYAALMKIEDPYEYRDRFTMPKLILNASGDQFFLPDSSQFYFDDLPGTKYLRYVPNADHSLRNSDGYQTLLAFYNALLNGRPLPKFDWNRDKSETLRVKAQDQPAEVRLWQATNPEARDFRLENIGPVWKSSLLTEEDGAYSAKLEKPAKGWTAYFIELTFPSGIAAAPFKLTTPVRVVPDVEPFKFVPKRPLGN